MSGNKIIAFTFFAFLLTNCAVSGSKSQRSGSTYITPQEAKRDSIRASNELLIDSLPAVDSTVTVFKDTYHIAVALPFYLDSIRTGQDSTDEFTKGIFSPSVMAVEFYAGLTLALDSLEHLGLKAKVHVFDTNNDPERVKQITMNPDMKNMDLIVGPVYNNDLRVMADFAKRESIYMVSPLSPANKITEQNPYYMMVNPTIKVHCNKVFNYVMKNFSRQNIVVMSQPTAAELEYAREFETLFAGYRQSTGNSSMQFKKVVYASKGAPVPEDEEQPDTIDIKAETGDLKIHFDTYRQNIVIVASVDKAYILNLSRKLNSLLEDYEIIVFGLPVWGEYQNLRLDYIDKLNVHFSSSFNLQPDFYAKDNPVYGFFADSLKTEPSDFAVKGFDIMLFFGKLLQQFGIKFGEELVRQKADGFHTNFEFATVPAPSPLPVNPVDTIPQPPAVDFIENRFVHLLKYEKYSIVRVD